MRYGIWWMMANRGVYRDFMTALLVAVWWGEWVVRRLERRFDGVAVVQFCSFFPEIAESELACN
jgi:hypothetical protein